MTQFPEKPLPGKATPTKAPPDDDPPDDPDPEEEKETVPPPPINNTWNTDTFFPDSEDQLLQYGLQMKNLDVYRHRQKLKKEKEESWKRIEKQVLEIINGTHECID